LVPLHDMTATRADVVHVRVWFGSFDEFGGITEHQTKLRESWGTGVVPCSVAMTEQSTGDTSAFVRDH
jgi:hypothetical protein